MRTAIRIGWEKAQDKDKAEIFGNFAIRPDHYPTNSEFIFVAAEYINSKYPAENALSATAEHTNESNLFIWQEESRYAHRHSGFFLYKRNVLQ